MPDTTPEAQVSPEGRAHAVPRPVLGSRLCPVCQEQPLQGEQTACSAACRRKRSRQRNTERQQFRDGEVLALLEYAERLEARAVELRAQACQRLRA